VNAPQYDVNVVSAPWTSILGNSTLDPSLGPGLPTDNPADSLAPASTNYMVDYQNGAIAVPAETYDQVFVFTVTPMSSATPPPSPVTVTLDVPAYNSTTNPNPYSGTVWMTFATGSASINYVKTGTVPAGPWIPGSDVLYRPFSYVPNPTPPTAPAWNASGQDPYQYSFANPSYAVAGTSTVTNMLNVGTLIFNPYLPAQQGQSALNVRASYVVYDWHILHEDHTLPALAGNPDTTTATQSTVRLMIGDIKRTGDVAQDGSVYSGLYEVPLVSNSDFTFVNLDTGFQTSTFAITDTDTTALGPGLIGASYHNGYLYLPPMKDLSGALMTHFRVFYRGTLDWGVAVQRAPAVYVPTPYITTGTPGYATFTYFDTPQSLVPPTYTGPPATTPVGADTYFLGSAGPIMAFLPPPSTGNWPTVDLNTPNLYYLAPSLMLYLPLCDLGKSITLHDVTVTVGTGATQQTGTLNAVTVTMQTAVAGLASYTDINLDDPLQSTTIYNLIAQLDTAYGAGAPPPVLTVGSVTGESVRAVVVWRENNVWREHYLDNILAN
ncbi:MAG: hypothetical protein ACLQVD_21300, partial [Capsulimonadaceae bacterium]